MGKIYLRTLPQDLWDPQDPLRGTLDVTGLGGAWPCYTRRCSWLVVGASHQHELRTQTLGQLGYAHVSSNLRPYPNPVLVWVPRACRLGVDPPYPNPVLVWVPGACRLDVDPPSWVQRACRLTWVPCAHHARLPVPKPCLGLGTKAVSLGRGPPYPNPVLVWVPRALVGVRDFAVMQAKRKTVNLASQAYNFTCYGIL